MHRSFAPLLSLPLLTAGMAGCVEQDGAAVVAVLPLSGQFSQRGDIHKRAIQSAFAALEEAGSAKHVGKPFRLVPVSSGNGKEEVAAEMERVMAENDVLAVISSTGAAHEGSLRAALAAQVPHFEVSSGSDDDEFLNGDERASVDPSFAFSTRALCFTEAQVTANFIAAAYKGKKLALLRGNQVHDIMHTEVVRGEIERLNAAADAEGRPGDKVILVNDAASEDGAYALGYGDDINYESVLNSINADHAPDVIFWHLRGDDANGRLWQDAARVGFQGALVTCGMSRKTSLLDNSRNGGVLDYMHDRLHFVMRAPPQTTALDSFKAEYQQEWRLSPDTWTPAAFDAGVLIGLGLVKTKGKSGEELRDAILELARPEGELIDYKSFDRAVSLLSAGTDINYDGPSGSLDIKEGDKHHVPGAYYVEIVKRGDGAVGQFVIREDWSESPILIE